MKFENFDCFKKREEKKKQPNDDDQANKQRESCYLCVNCVL